MDGLPRTGERLAHYRIVDKLGAGGMGEVYRAHDETLHRDVAIKLLPPDSLDDPGARARLVREARAAAALNHPYICTVHEVGESGGQAYIAMELVEGQTLGERLASGSLPGEQVVRYGMQLAEALGHAHDRGVLHRDLKSANVIVTPSGRVKVLDFGLAKRLNASELTTQMDATAMGAGTVAGTLPYMAPEQLRGQPAQAASDVWALGVVLYEMAHGARPFQGQTSFEVSAAILNQAPAPFAASVPAGLQSIVSRCLEKEPGQRYRSGSEVCAALEMLQTRGESAPISDTRPIAPLPPAPVKRDRRAWITRRQAIWLGAAAIAIAGGVTAWKMWPANLPVRSIAVLPFQNVQNDETLDHVCDGITDGLIRRIKAITSLRVVALRRVLHYRGHGVDARDVGRDLNVENVLSGTVTRQGTKLKIDVALTETVRGTVLWSDTYTFDASALLDVQDDIASAIMDEGLRVSLSAAERQRLVQHPTSDAQAYDLYLQAGYLQRRGREDEYLRARDLLERAIKRDDKFSLAYAAMSAIYAMSVVDGYMRPTDAWALVDKYLRQAVATDPQFPDTAGYEHAQAFFFYWNWPAAESARKKVLETKAKHFDMEDLRALAIERWALGHADEALALVRRTREVDPLNPDMMSVEADYLRQTGQLDAAAALYRESIKIDPTNPGPYSGLAEVFALQRRFDEASDYRRQAHALEDEEAIAEAFAQAKGEAGYRQADRLSVLQQLKTFKERMATAAYVSPLDVARAHVMLGDKEQAFRYLKDALHEHSPGMVFLNVDRAWDSVRGDPQFLEFVRRVGLPDPAGSKGKTP
jgi:TolB-like protein/Tfp pilus assembly protein PilF